jgi:hypothetical protein
MPASTSTSRTAVVDAAGHRLRGDAAASYQRMLADGMPAGGVDVFTRTMAEQQTLYDRYRAGKGPIAARPSATAPHVDGRAMDLHTTTAGKYAPSAAHAWLTTGGDGSSKPKAGEKLRAHTYGWRRTVPSERWHFEYDRAKDTRRAADLAARLKTLGYPTVAAFQAAHRLTPDGVDGPITWAALLTDPSPSKEEPVTGRIFQAAQLNVQAKRWGGGIYAKDAVFIRDTLRPSIMMTQETDEIARDAIRAKTGFKVYPHLYLGLFWVPEDWDHGDRMTLSLGTAYHGAVAAPLTDRAGGGSLVACSAHIRPNDALPGSAAKRLTAKQADIGKVIRMLAKYPRVLVAGDWNTSTVYGLMQAAGYQLATPKAATTDAGDKLDGIFVRGLTVRDGRIIPTSVSDHHGLVAALTLPAIITN